MRKQSLIQRSKPFSFELFLFGFQNYCFCLHRSISSIQSKARERETEKNNKLKTKYNIGTVDAIQLRFYYFQKHKHVYREEKTIPMKSFATYS